MLRRLVLRCPMAPPGAGDGDISLELVRILNLARGSAGLWVCDHEEQWTYFLLLEGGEMGHGNPLIITPR